MSYSVNTSPLATYNSLADEHLAQYYTNPRIRRHLLRAGLITRDGCIVDELTYRENVARREHQDHVRNLLAQTIIDKALDIERTRQNEIKKKLEEFNKLEMVRRVKDRKLRRGDEDFLTLLTPHMMPTPPVAPSPREKGGNHRRQRKVSDESKQLHDSLVGSPYSMSPAPNGRATGFLSESDGWQLRRVNSSPPAFKRKKRRPKTAPTLSSTEPLLFKRTQTQSLARVTLRYLGSTLHLEGSLESQDADITVIQQHGGGSSLCVFRGPVLPNSKFVFTSKRSRGTPFGITIYVGGMLKSRLSTCCEYKYKPGHLLGGKQSQFQLIQVSEAAPCYKCQAEAELNAPSHWELKQPRKKAHSVGPTMRHQSGEESEDLVTWMNGDVKADEKSEVDVDEVLKRFRSARYDGNDDDDEFEGIDLDVTKAVSVAASVNATPSPSRSNMYNTQSQLPVPVIAVQQATPLPSDAEGSESENEVASSAVASQEAALEEKRDVDQDDASGYLSDKEEESDDNQEDKNADERDQARPASNLGRHSPRGRRPSSALSSSSSSSSSSHRSHSGEHSDRNYNNNDADGVNDNAGEEAVIQAKEDTEVYDYTDFEDDEEKMQSSEDETLPNKETETTDVKEERHASKSDKDRVAEELADDVEQGREIESDHVQTGSGEDLQKHLEATESVEDDEPDVAQLQVAEDNPESNVSIEGTEQHNEPLSMEGSATGDVGDAKQQTGNGDDQQTETERDKQELETEVTVDKEADEGTRVEDNKLEEEGEPQVETLEQGKNGVDEEQDNKIEEESNAQGETLEQVKNTVDEEQVVQETEETSELAGKADTDNELEKKATQEEAESHQEILEEEKNKETVKSFAQEITEMPRLEDQANDQQIPIQQNEQEQQQHETEEESFVPNVEEKQTGALELEHREDEVSVKPTETEDESTVTPDLASVQTAETTEDPADSDQNHTAAALQAVVFSEMPSTQDAVDNVSEEDKVIVKEVQDAGAPSEETPSGEHQEDSLEQANSLKVDFREAPMSSLHAPLQERRMVKSESSLPQISLSRSEPSVTRSVTNIESLLTNQSESSETEAPEAEVSPDSTAERDIVPPLKTMMSAKRLLRQPVSGTSLKLSDDEANEHSDDILSESDTAESILNDIIPALSPGSDSKETSPVDDTGMKSIDSVATEGHKLAEQDKDVGHTPTTSKVILTQPIAQILEGKTEAEISNVALTTEQVSELAAIIDKPETSVNTVSLRNSAVGDEAVSVLTDAISTNKDKVQMLNLNLNNLTPDGAKQIANNVLRNNTSLQYLLLHGNPIGDEGFCYIVDALVATGHSDVEVTDDIADQPTSSTNDVPQEHKERRSQQSSSSSSSSSDSSDEEETQKPETKPKLEAESSQRVAQMSSLMCLDVGDCSLTSESAPHVARLLHSNGTLTELNLSVNHLSALGWREIAHTLQGNATLSSLRLDYCSMGDDGLVELCDAFAHNSSLKSLDLEGNNITERGASVLLEALKVNKSLVEVTIVHGNSIEKATLDSIQTILKEHKRSNDR